MPSKPRFPCLEKDDLVWQKLDEDTERWQAPTRTREMHLAVGKFILDHKPGEPELMHIAVKGGYNTVYRLEYKDGPPAIMRVPVEGLVQFPEEKVQYEVPTMRHVAAHTSIPVPHIYHHGSAAENPTGLGPFIIMDYIERHQNMSRELLDPERPIDERPTLNPAITEKKLELLFGQMASILLQLSKLKFPRIGLLVKDKDQKSAYVGGRPLIANMNEIVVHTNAPESTLPPSQTYTSAHDWYRDLADIQMTQVTFQRNDMVDDEDDARDMYVARQLFRNLAGEKHLISPESEFEGDSRLFSEDLRPANVLLDEDLQIVGVIDWEFAYAAPAQCTFDSPW